MNEKSKETDTSIRDVSGMMASVRTKAQPRYKGDLYVSAVDCHYNEMMHPMAVLRQSSRLLSVETWLEDEIFAVSTHSYETPQGTTILAAKPSPKITDIAEEELQRLVQSSRIDWIEYISLPFYNPLLIQF